MMPVSARDSLDTLDALGFPAIAFAAGTSTAVGMNAAAARLLGATAEDWLDRVYPRDRAELEAACKTLASRAEFRETSDQLKFRRFQIELRPRGELTLGLLVEMMGHGTSEPELAALIEALPFEVWERDDSGVLVRQNSMALRNWGARLGSVVADMGMPPDTAGIWTALNDRALHGEVVSHPLTYTVAGQTVHYVNLIAPVRDGERVCGVVGVNIDVTQTRAAEAERDASLARARAALDELARAQSTLVKRERLAALGELAAVVAHEVRNPLAAIYNSISALKRKVSLDSDAALLFEILEEEAERLNRTVGDSLSYVRPLQPERRPDDVVELAREVVRHNVPSDASGAIGSEIVALADVHPISIDPVLLRIALSNLVTNAVQSMPDGGKLTVTVSEAKHEERDAVAIAVHDTGKGIPNDVLPRVFEPFFTTRASGAGLGLAVVRRIVEAHDGLVMADSDERRGTVFTVLIPR